MAFDAHSKRMNLAVSGRPGTAERFVFLFKINTLTCVDYLRKETDYVYDHEEEERSTIHGFCVILALVDSLEKMMVQHTSN